MNSLLHRTITPSLVGRKVLESHGIKRPAPKPPLPPVEWIENNFYLYDTGNLINLFDCQRRPLELALSRDANGNFNYTVVLWAWPKKSAKSSVIAAVADYTAAHRFNGSVKLVANDLKQADSRVGMYLRKNIEIGKTNGIRSPAIKVNPSGYKVTYPNGAIIECVPIDPTGEAGGNDDMIVYSELWGWKSKAHQRMWTEMTLSPNKWGNSQRWIDTYAGIKGESPILEQLYETGVKQGRQVWPDLEVYVNDAAKMLTVWVTKPMFPWQTEEYYASERGVLVPSEYARVHENAWSDSSETFVPEQWWQACQLDSIPDIGRRGVVMGLDAAAKDDCFAIILVSKKNGSAALGTPDKVQVRYSKAYYPPQGGRIKFQDVKDEIVRLFKVFNVVQVAYDPTQLESMSQELGGGVHWKEFPQGVQRAIADKRLYDMIRDEQVEHLGDVDLKEHIQNSNKSPEDNGRVRIVKRETTKKIDLAVALSMATDRAMELNL